MSKSKTISNEQIIEALLTCSSQTAAAKRLGCTKQTICNRLKCDSALTEALAERRKNMLDTVSNKLVNASESATETLVSMLHSENDYVRYQVALQIIKLSKEYITIEDISARLERLESLAND